MQESKASFDPFQPYEEPFDPEQSKQGSSYIIAEESESDQEWHPESIDTYTADISRFTGDISKPQQKIVVFPASRLDSQHRFRVLQKWEGTVIEISKDECRALIKDLTSPDLIEEITFSTEEIPGRVESWRSG